MDIGKVDNTLMNGLTDSTTTQSVNKAADESFEQSLKAAMEKKDDKELKAVCQQFEGIMLNMMYSQMKATIQKSELIPEDAGREIFEPMLDEELMNQASRTSNFGLADSLYKQLSKRLGSGGENDK